MDPIIRGTTPTVVDEIAAEYIGCEAHFTIGKERKPIVHKKGVVEAAENDLGAAASFALTREETLALKKGTAYFQTLLERDGKVYGSPIEEVEILETIEEGALDD